MFIVLADSRTGSHLLKSLLNSHPDLPCYDEILGLRKDEKNFYSLQRGNQQVRSLSKEKAAVLCNYLQVPVTELHTNLYKIRKFGDCPA